MTTSLVSRQELVRFVNISEDDARYDSVLESFAVMSSTLIESFLGRGLEYGRRVEYHRSYLSFAGDDLAQVIWLGAYPVDKGEGVEIRFSPSLSWDAGILLVEHNHFWMVDEEGVLNIMSPASGQGSLVMAQGSHYGNHPAGFRVTYTGGYKHTGEVNPSWDYLAVPPAMATAAAMQTAFYFNAHTKGALGLDTGSGDSASAQKTKPVGSDMEPWGGLIPEVRAALRPFVRKGSLVGSIP